METKNKLQITPETKIGALLDSYPDLEETLLELAPAFSKLKSPILRKTVARVTTLGQAARIGGVPLGTMINTLRAASGNGHFDESLIVDDDVPGGKPAWLNDSAVARTIDAGPLLARGEHPVALVMSELDAVPAGQALLLLTPFLPLPLIDKARAKGFSAWSDEEDKMMVKTYFFKHA